MQARQKFRIYCTTFFANYKGKQQDSIRILVNFSYKKVGILFMARNDNESAIEYFEDYLKFDLPKEEKKTIEDLISRISK